MNRFYATGESLEGYRAIAKVSQAEMAEAMRIALRTYEDLATGKSPTRMVHIRAAERALIGIAQKYDDPSRLPDHLKELAIEVRALVDGEVTCPISEDPATVIPTTGDYREFVCPTCGQFRISGTAIAVVTHLPVEERRERLAEAKRNSVPGAIPFVWA